MLKKRIMHGALLLFFLILTACSNDDETQEGMTGNEVTDEELIAVVEENVKKLMEKDAEGYMATIHSESPVYNLTSDAITKLFDSDLEIELLELEVAEKLENEATILYKQRTTVDNASFQDNETNGKHVLRLENGDWKIYHSEQLDIKVIEPEEPRAEAVEMEGIYADKLSAMNLPDEEWVLADYTERNGEATAEYIPKDKNLGNYDEMITIDYYENGNVLSGLTNFVNIFETSMNNMTSGEFEFTRLAVNEAEVFYHFSVNEDSNQDDQEEIGRIFVRDNDIYLLRYTAIEQEIADAEKWMETLSEME